MARAAIQAKAAKTQRVLAATKTAIGAARMLVMSTDGPQELRRKVTSPGGTTHAAITHMESNNLPGIIVDALKAAEQRGRELGQ